MTNIILYLLKVKNTFYPLRRKWENNMLLAILALATILRFVNYYNRWGLLTDQSAFAINGRYALMNLKLPLLGPFSSAGPFQTGGEWYWFIMVGWLINPYWVLSPWVFLTLISILFVYLSYRIASEMVDKKFGLVVSSLVAVSPMQVLHAVYLTSQPAVAFLSLLSIWVSIRFIRTKKEKYLFILSFLIGLASSIHLSGVAILPLLLILLVYYRSKKISMFFFVGILFLVPWLPVLYIDIQNNFFNTINMIDYYMFNKNKVPFEVLGRRWLTFISIFVPQSWGNIIGGHSFFGYILPLGIGAFLFQQLYKKRIKIEWIVISISTFLMFAILRYTRTPLFDSYLLFIHPFVLFLSGWMVYNLIVKMRVVGLLFLLLLLVGSLYKDYSLIISSSNSAASTVVEWKEILERKYSNKKFALYDYQYKTVDKSISLSLILDVNQKINDNGFKVGVMIASEGATLHHPIISGKKGGYVLLDLNASSSAKLYSDKWEFVNPSRLYQLTQEWYKYRE